MRTNGGHSRLSTATGIIALSMGIGIGCSSSSSPPALGDDGLTSEQLSACVDLVRANCAKRDACTNGKGNIVRYGDAATCETREKLTCVQAMTAPGTAQSAANAEACVPARIAESCVDYFARNEPAACALHGSQPTGGVCNAFAQCQSGYCSFPLGASCGTCAPQPNAGDPCPSGNDCGRGLLCVMGTCVKPAGQGAACSRNGECVAGMSCVGASGTQKGTCQTAASTVGAACDPKEATGPGCDSALRLWCAPTAKQCVAYTFASAGQPCGANGEGYAQCTAGASCTNGTCVAAAADNTPCDTTNGPGCLAPALCVTSGGTSGTCLAPSRACR